MNAPPGVEAIRAMLVKDVKLNLVDRLSVAEKFPMTCVPIPFTPGRPRAGHPQPSLATRRSALFKRQKDLGDDLVCRHLRD